MTESVQTSLNIPQKHHCRANSVKGRLVHENPIQAAASSVKSYGKNAKYLRRGLNGRGDDYSIGKINDLTTKLGSLGIAAMLASTTKNPASKAMEFVGFLSFFASMSIWPKLFIETPIKAKDGFNINQQYVDSYGRRKRFFEDSQYLPWDLWSKQDLDKVGDKLNISKDIPNRTSETQNKMKQISTQANTLWMLTAGFATPLMASLMGNYASKYVEKVTETTRVQNAIKQTGMADFTKDNDTLLKKVFVNPVAKLFSHKTMATDNDEMLKNLDSAFDAIFGKDTDTSFEYNKATKLYKAPDNQMLTQFDEKTGMTIVKDENGKILSKIKSKNVDGISLFGDKWKVIPNKMADILGISPKEYKNITKNILEAGENNSVKHKNEEIADLLIGKFAGKENKEALQSALNKMEKVLAPSIKELDDAEKSYGTVLENTIKNMEKSINKTNKDTILSKINDIGKAQQLRLENKVINTKVSWFSPVRILDIIAKHSDEDMANPALKASLKKELSDFINGVTPQDINNNFNTIIGEDFSYSAKYAQGLKKYYAKLSDSTKSMMKDKDLFANIDKTTSTIAKKLVYVSNPVEKAKNCGNICEWLGKTPKALIEDAAKQNGIYRGWLKKVGGAFGILAVVTLTAVSQFGKVNKYNPDMNKVQE